MFKPKSHTPTSVASILQNLVNRKNLKHKISQYENFSSWKDIVGEDLAKISFPEKIISNKILSIKVLDAAWGQEIILNKQEILDKLNREWKNIYFEDLRISVGSPKDFKCTNS